VYGYVDVTSTFVSKEPCNYDGKVQVCSDLCIVPVYKLDEPRSEFAVAVDQRIIECSSS